MDDQEWMRKLADYLAAFPVHRWDGGADPNKGFAVVQIVLSEEDRDELVMMLRYEGSLT